MNLRNISYVDFEKERHKTIKLPVEYSAKVFIDLEEKTSDN